MKFLVDAQLPPALARRIRELGHEAEHVHDIGLGQATDAAIWEYATATSCVLISKDQDFALMRIWKVDGPPVIWVRWGNVRRLELLRRLNDAFPRILAAFERGETFIEIWE